jgi:membrane-bound metal-dependent hydrolase YbcI (DUF457 family)
MALAYLIDKSSSKLLEVNLNVPLIMVLSIIPDIDLLFIPLLHRGPTHSIITATLVFIPIFLVYRKRAVPYFIAIISHSLIADFFIGGRIMLFWPLSQAEFGLHELGSYYITISNPINAAAELILFTAATAVLIKTDNFRQFFKNQKINLVLIIPIFTVLMPSIIGYPLQVPILLVPPHLFFLALFVISVIVVLAGFFQESSKNRNIQF